MAVSEKVLDRIANPAQDSNKLHILISGRTGVGKSTLVNRILGTKVAQESDTLEAETIEVITHRVTLHGVEVAVFDTPGLQDSIAKEAVVAHCHNVDLALYCTRMDGRFHSGEDLAVNAFTEAFGKTFWDKAIFVLTFANQLTPSYRMSDPVERKKIFESLLHQWTETLYESLRKCGVPQESAQRVPVIPAGDEELSLPDRKDWLADLWFACYQRIGASIRPALVKLNQQRLKTFGEVTISQGITELLPTVDPSVLTEDDLYDVLEEVSSLAGTWQSLGLALRLQSDVVADDQEECLRAVLLKWLQQSYNTQKHGPPTWRALVAAVANRSGGSNQALAQAIAQSHQGITKLLPTVDASVLTEDDLYDVLEEVSCLAGRWHSLGLALRLRPSDVSVIAHLHYNHPEECLRAVLLKWLQQSYNTQKHGPPTWRALVAAVTNRSGGSNQALAQAIAQSHQAQEPSLSTAQEPSLSTAQEPAVHFSRLVQEAATSELVADTEGKKLRRHFSLIVELLAASVDPRELAVQLYAAGLISKVNLESAMSVSGITRSNTIRRLLLVVLDRVTFNPANYRKFINILREFEYLEDLVQRLSMES